jgi:hypothetical protein
VAIIKSYNSCFGGTAVLIYSHVFLFVHSHVYGPLAVHVLCVAVIISSHTRTIYVSLSHCSLLCLSAQLNDNEVESLLTRSFVK